MLVAHILQPISLFLALLLTLGLYLLWRDRLTHLFLEDKGRPPLLLDRCPWVSVVGLVIVCSNALLVITQSENISSRPVWVLLCTSVPSIVVFIQILLKVYRYEAGEFSLLMQVIVASMTIILSTVIVFPFDGADTWAHLANADLLQDQGSFNVIEAGYKNYPLFPALVNFLRIISGVDPSRAARIITLLFSVVCLMLLYSLVSEYYGSVQRGLISILILLGSKWFIYWSTLVVSMSAAMLLFTAFYVLLTKRLFLTNDGRTGSVLTILYILVAIISPFLHPVGSIAIILLCIGYFLTAALFTLNGNKGAYSNLIVISLFVVVVTITQWIFYGQTFVLAMRSLIAAIFEDTAYSVRLAASTSEPLTYFVDNMNFYLLLCFSLVELLRQIRIRKDPLVLLTGITGMIFVGFAFSMQITNLQAVLPYRWLLFGSILLVIPAANILASMMRTTRIRWKLLLTAGFSIFVFFGYITKDINRDHPLYSIRSAQLYQITYPEYSGLQFAKRGLLDLHTLVQVDYRLWDYLKYQTDSAYLGYWDEYLLQERNMIFADRDVYRVHRDAFLGDSVENLDLSRPGLNQIYDNGELRWLEWVP